MTGVFGATRIAANAERVTGNDHLCAVLDPSSNCRFRIGVVGMGLGDVLAEDPQLRLVDAGIDHAVDEELLAVGAGDRADDADRVRDGFVIVRARHKEDDRHEHERDGDNTYPAPTPIP